MKKILQFSLITIILLSIFTVPQSSFAATNYEDPSIQPDEDLNVQPDEDPSIQPYNADLSILAKSTVPEACGYYARSSNEEVEESIEPYAIKLSSEVRTSDLGSKIVMPAINGVYNTGYCHIFERHMYNSDGGYKTTVNGASQFAYAHFTDATMQIVMEVINGTTLLVDEADGKKSKSKYSKTAKQNVKVILRRGSDVTIGNYSAYDWVVVTAYPIGF